MEIMGVEHKLDANPDVQLDLQLYAEAPKPLYIQSLKPCRGRTR